MEKEIKILKTKDDVTNHRMMSKETIIPTRGKVLVTTNVEEVSESELEDPVKVMSDRQYVWSSPENGLVKSGDRVLLDLTKMLKAVQNPNDAYDQSYELDLDMIEHNGAVLAFVPESAIKAIIKEKSVLS